MIDDDITPKPGVVCLVPLDRLLLLPSAYVPAAKIERLLAINTAFEPIEVAPCQGRPGFAVVLNNNGRVAVARMRGDTSILATRFIDRGHH